ncbi:hypothetical protein HDU67_009047 [Dinochytrium kinnereticum]|nr:hypothetical protein HDU67_009047 [Dinochytrium kinnereticum]
MNGNGYYAPAAEGVSGVLPPKPTAPPRTQSKAYTAPYENAIAQSPTHVGPPAGPPPPQKELHQYGTKPEPLPPTPTSAGFPPNLQQQQPPPPSPGNGPPGYGSSMTYVSNAPRTSSIPGSELAASEGRPSPHLGLGTREPVPPSPQPYQQQPSSPQQQQFQQQYQQPQGSALPPSGAPPSAGIQYSPIYKADSQPQQGLAAPPVFFQAPQQSADPVPVPFGDAPPSVAQQHPLQMAGQPPQNAHTGAASSPVHPQPAKHGFMDKFLKPKSNASNQSPAMVQQEFAMQQQQQQGGLPQPQQQQQQQQGGKRFSFGLGGSNSAPSQVQAASKSGFGKVFKGLAKGGNQPENKQASQFQQQSASQFQQQPASQFQQQQAPLQQQQQQWSRDPAQGQPQYGAQQGQR